MKRSVLTWIIAGIIASGLNAQNKTAIPDLRKYSANLNTGMSSQINIDSLISGSQKYDPLFRNFPAWSDLGNMAMPALPMKYTGIGKTTMPAFLKPYMSYLSAENEIQYYNTKTPYSQFNYNQEITSGKDNVAQLLKFFYSRNFGHDINVTGIFDFNSSTGQYKNQSSTESLIGLNLSVEKRKYKHFASLERIQFKTQENGGVRNDSLAYSVDKQYSIIDVDVMLSDASSETGMLRLRGWQYLDILGKNVNNSLDSAKQIKAIRGFNPVIVHHYNYNSAKRIYGDPDPSLDFYPDTLIDGSFTRDSVQHFGFENELSLRMNVPFRDSINLLAEAGLKHNLMHFYSFENPQWKQSVGVRAYSSMEIKDVKIAASGSLMFAGYQAGDHELELKAGIKGQGRSLYPELIIFSRAVTPDLFVAGYYSNHFSWITSFKNQKEQGVGFNLSIPGWKLDLETNLNLVSDWIYFDEMARPAQRSKSTMAANLIIRKNIKAGPFRSDNYVCLNYTPADEIPLPLLAASTSTYMHHEIHFNKTKGLLQVEYGFDIRYTTGYKGFAYMPATGVFFLQNERTLGNYPLADLFFMMRVKRTRFFVKWDHVNYGLTGDKIFSVLHYPMKHRYLKLGVYWHFYD